MCEAAASAWPRRLLCAAAAALASLGRRLLLLLVVGGRRRALEEICCCLSCRCPSAASREVCPAGQPWPPLYAVQTPPWRPGEHLEAIAAKAEVAASSFVILPGLN